MLGTMRHTEASVSDYLWAVLAVVAGIAAGMSVVMVLNSVASLGSSDLSVWGRIAPVGVALGYLAALSWVTAGAWRRTVWGCRLSNTEKDCPRHGSRCAASLGARGGGPSRLDG
ncbi:MAG: hypothetical protein KY469_04540 [Actinobacteria bacterium]|nr:hypothetical protein [Actinomycetota bacterium]